MQGIAPHPCHARHTLTRRLLWQTKPRANLPEGTGPDSPGEGARRQRLQPSSSPGTKPPELASHTGGS